MRTIKIKAGFSGVISTGNYENERPYFEVEEILEISQTGIEQGEIMSTGFSDEEIKERQKELQQMCYNNFKAQERRSLAEKIQKMREDLRFYDINGEQYPSVTSIIDWDSDFHVTPEELVQYGARGSIIHKQVEEYIKTKKWKDPKSIPECYPDIVILKKGGLGLSYDDVDFMGFLEKNPIEFLESEKRVINEKHKYAGRYDFIGKMDGKVTLFDVKTGSSVDNVKAFKQLTAYAKCEKDIEQICVIHLNKKTKQGFSKPKIEANLDKFWALFKKDRENFKRRFGI